MAPPARKPILLIALVVVIAAGGAMTFTALRDGDPYPGPWRRVGADVGVSKDRMTIYAQEHDYTSGSCYGHRLVVTKGPSQWRVAVEVRREGKWCTLEGCINDRSEFLPEGGGDELRCGILDQQVPGGVPEGVEVVAA